MLEDFRRIVDYWCSLITIQEIQIEKTQAQYPIKTWSHLSDPVKPDSSWSDETKAAYDIGKIHAQIEGIQ